MKTTITKQIEVDIADYTLNTTLKDYFDRREAMGVPLVGLQNCFSCEEKIALTERPRLVKIKNMSNKLICSKCYEKYSKRVETKKTV